MPNTDLVHMHGHAIAVPVQAAVHAANDAAALAVAATERAAYVAARSTVAHLPKPIIDLAHVTVSLPHGSKPALGESEHPHVLVHEDGATKLMATPSLHKHKQHRVDYDFFCGIAPEIAHLGGALPGANKWDEPVGAEHPIPVILVYGTGGGGQTNWGPHVPLLVVMIFRYSPSPTARSPTRSGRSPRWLGCG